MQKESISARNFTCLVILTLVGNTAFGGVSETGQDSWFTLLAAAIVFIPFALVYSRIMKLFPGRGIFEITEELFGKWGSRILTALLVWFCIHVCALVLNSFTVFTIVSALPETPSIPVMIAFFLVTIYLAKSGIELMGRWAKITCFVVFAVVLFTVIMALSSIDLDSLFPVLNTPVEKLASQTLLLFSFPFAEMFVFLALAGSLKKGESPVKVHLYGLLIAAAVLLVIQLRNITVLGSEMLKSTYFPSYVATRVMHLGTFFERSESSISFNFVLFGLGKTAVFLLAASRGTAKLFNVSEPKKMIAPVSIIILALCCIVYKNGMQVFSFLEVFKYYALPFEVLIPLIVWIAAEIKERKKGKLPAKKEEDSPAKSAATEIEAENQ